MKCCKEKLKKVKVICYVQNILP
uniref:Uncharacterized protein n=1 Tax=Arundo donax TaxID=35708 RepID=A0A0A8ZPZ5_ARUDO